MIKSILATKIRPNIPVLLTAALLAPLAVVIAHFAIPDVSIWQHLIDTVLASYVINSTILALGVAVGTLLLGTLTAWLMSHYSFTGRRVLRVALLLPLAMPAYIIAYSYTGLLDVSGPLQQVLRETFEWRVGDYWFPQVRSLPSAIILMSLVLYPYVYILARTAFSEQSASMREVAKIHGYSSAQYFIRVSIPLARPALFTGAALAMMEALADYGTVQFFGINTFTTGIFRSWYAMGSRTTAIQLAGILSLFVLLVLVFEQHSRRRIKYFQQTSVRSSPLIVLSGWRNSVVCACCFLPFLLGFVIPSVQLLVWASMTFEHIVWSDYWQLVSATFGLALVTAFIVVLIAALYTYQNRWSGSALSRWQIRLLSLGYALPGMVIAVGALMVLGWLDGNINNLLHAVTGRYAGLILSGTVFALVFCYCVRFMSVALQNTEAGILRIKPSLDEAALTMGATRSEVLSRIHLPLLRASLFSAGLLVFVDVLKELPATLVLRPFNFNTLAVRAYEMASDERLFEAAMPALTIVAVSLVPIFLITKTIDNTSEG
ncbi:iron ABC transporter permease [Alteromonas sp. ASW11-36]|uniref:Iron ABC transporter permease n=1 Tax=Alteromonas arenosi TaxID=3055817 RepID=A0ABT7SUU8_9ALTE|nr:iron ABC transporter permease [Alteromonas sp. ASW11-36]MDM7859961.1 iron ABC transporter permease [Alteromonas sp. ASW11-36]